MPRFPADVESCRHCIFRDERVGKAARAIDSSSTFYVDSSRRVDEAPYFEAEFAGEIGEEVEFGEC